MSYKQDLEKDEKEFGIGNKNFKFIQGKNRVRIITAPRGFQSVFEDKQTGEQKISTKFLCYLLDRSDQTFKTAFLPYHFVKGLGELEEDELAPWSGQFPMPYDVTMDVDEPGKITVTYGAVRATKETELTNAERQAIDALKPIQEVRDALSAKQSPKQQTMQEELDSIPFDNN